MKIISFDMTNTNYARVKRNLLALYPNIEGITEDNPTPSFTDDEWVNELVRRWIVSQVERNEQRVAQAQIVTPSTDNIIN